ncbi:hypothetical protein MLD38_023126 [Melastoma candidum]|uniref:Uncharacterized protein n=1 Tax=Melastoma candidum TaxID=119954 RepID=A0ACB9QMP7_9MYRT|nr:hypothetical protein MLD38_023126 [Melastoma candidum]
MGCVTSKLGEEEEVVSICRERKRFLKLAIQRRSALAEAHFRYCESLYAVSAAVRLFIARHSSPASPFLITFSPTRSSSTPPASTAGGLVCGGSTATSALLLQQRPSEPTKETVVPPPPPLCESCGKGSSSSDDESECCRSSEGEAVEEGAGNKAGRDLNAGFCDEGRNGYYFMEMQAQAAASPGRNFAWDFFNPFFGMGLEEMDGYRVDDRHLRAVREEEGIPELEEEVLGEYVGAAIPKKVGREENVAAIVTETRVLEGVVGRKEGGCVVTDSNGKDDGGGRQKGMTFVDDDPEKGRELLEALGDIEDHFIRAYDSGKEVSRMLEASKVHLMSDIQGIKENSTKLLQSIAWNRSTSCKSLVSYSSRSSSNWTEYKNDLFEDYDGMVSGSHSLTLERLYAWEKKLFEEVKAGDDIRKLYERKCSRIRDEDVRGDDSHTMDKNRLAMKDLYARIFVAIRSAESISMMIEKLRDEELQPQIVELLKGLMQTWKIMLESHETQNKIASKVSNFACPSYGKFCNNFHRLATLQLEAELQHWRECFVVYIAAQKSYAEALDGWLSKFLAPEIEFCSRGRSSAVPFRINGPPLLPICHNWLISLNKLPEKAVAIAMKGFAKDVRVLWTQQGEEQQQKRKVDSLVKELEKRMPASFPKAEVKLLEFKVSEEKFEPDPDENGYLSDKLDHVDTLRRKLGAEKERHQKCMEETHRVTLNGFRAGFGAVFESLTEFSKAAETMYSGLVTRVESSEEEENVPCIADSRAEETTLLR